MLSGLLVTLGGTWGRVKNKCDENGGAQSHRCVGESRNEEERRRQRRGGVKRLIRV